MPVSVVLAGVGGQGVVYATKVLASAGLKRGQRVTAAENHGMSQRGGSVMSHLKLDGGVGPLIRRGAADCLLAFDRAEALRNLTYLRPGALAVVNLAEPLPPAILARLAELNVRLECLDATALATRLGRLAAANLVLLGRAAAVGLGLGLDDLKAAVQALGPAAAVAPNWQALDEGARQYETL